MVCWQCFCNILVIKNLSNFVDLKESLKLQQCQCAAVDLIGASDPLSEVITTCISYPCLEGCNFTKKIQHRCFSVKFAKFLRKSILKNSCERLLLNQLKQVYSFFHKTQQWRFRSSYQRCSIKNALLKISQNSEENACVAVSFPTKLVWRLQLY